MAKALKRKKKIQHLIQGCKSWFSIRPERLLSVQVKKKMIIYVKITFTLYWYDDSLNPLTKYAFREELQIDPKILGRSGGGLTCLPKFKFSVEFPIGLHMILQLKTKILKLDWIRCAKLFEPKIHWGASLHPYTSLQIILNGLCF